MILLALFGLGALASFAKELVLANVLGAGPVLDAFRVAYSIPQTIAMLAPTIVVASAMPKLQELRVRAPEQEAAFLSALVVKLLLGAAVLAGALNLFAGNLSRLLAPGFDQGTLGMAAAQLRWFSALPALLAVAAVMKAALDSRRRLLPGASQNLVMHGSQALGLIVLQAVGLAGGYPAVSLVATTLGSAALVVLFNGVSGAWLSPAKIRKAAALGLGNFGLPFPYSGVLAFTAFQILGQLSRFIDRSFASHMASGTVSSVEYSFSLVTFPAFLLSSAVITAFYPTLTKLLAEGRGAEARRRTLRACLILSLASAAVSIAFFALPRSIVGLVFRHSRLSREALDTIATVLQHQSYGIPFMVVGLLLAQCQMAWHQHRALAGIAVGKLILKYAATSLLVPALGVAGLGVSFSLSSMAGAAASGLTLAWSFRREPRLSRHGRP